VAVVAGERAGTTIRMLAWMPGYQKLAVALEVDQEVVVVAEAVVVACRIRVRNAAWLNNRAKSSLAK